MKDNLLTVLKYADGARCDMAHLVLNDVFGNTWKEELSSWGYSRPSTEFWEYAFKEAKSKYPNAILLAEVYEDWEKELGSVTRDLADEPEYQLPEPPAMMSAKKYKTTFVEPLISKLKELIRKLLSRIFEQRSYYESRLAQAESYQKRYRQMEQNYNAVKDEVERLKPYAQEDRFLRRVYGDVKITQMVNQKLQQKKDHARLYRNSGYDRDGR